MRAAQLLQEGRLPSSETFLSILEEAVAEHKRETEETSVKVLRGKIAKELSKPPHQRNTERLREWQSQLKQSK